MKEEQINTYLSYSEAVKESLIPGYKSDWKVEQPVTPEESVETPTEPETPITPEEQETPNPESPTEPVETPTEPNSEEVTTEPGSDPEVDPNAE